MGSGKGLNREALRGRREGISRTFRGRSGAIPFGGESGRKRRRRSRKKKRRRVKRRSRI
jgi:hypothetical protein